MTGTAVRPGRGRKPKSNNRKKLAGSKHVKPDEPKFSQITNINPPEWFDDLAVTMWEMVCPELCRERVLTLTDIHNLEVFCCSYSNWRKSQSEVSERGVTMVDAEDGKLKKNPAMTALNESARQMATFGAMLGLDPASRQRLIGGNKQDSGNRFSDF
ncbi:terminase [Endozoicomonas montiporae]|uniref:Terminase n=2 Tax=Endozoicomonas montiporae TaxID=1027273 RepID=A0A081N314_9GAMM|nr:phage terminase small subunit P27 family [Endozoicomonas montiporae]AMO58123.1 P27 family phage terminase small subunit [Endozoicomonas montiporae CL-33]KEQ12837.1 terminase [Endozoicomonas montiporae]